MADPARPLKSSADFTRGGGAPTPDHDADHASRTKRVEAEQRRLIQWAKENRKLGGRLPPEFGRGGEHQVYFHRAKKRYLKATLLERQLGYGIALGSHVRGATPSEYLDRLDLQNQIFNDDIRLERVVLTGGKPVIVKSPSWPPGRQQPFSTGKPVPRARGTVETSQTADAWRPCGSALTPSGSASLHFAAAAQSRPTSHRAVD